MSPSATADLAQATQAGELAAAEAGLRYVSDADDGLQRQRNGDGFVYRRRDGRRVGDEATLARIRAIAIPPAWTDVWICPSPRGHLQATGRDARVGNPEYARSNRSFGLTTLRNRHVAFVRGGRARFRFRGKGGLEHDVVLDDARLVRMVRHCQQLPGQALFQYRDDDGNVVPVESGEVNDYLRDATGEAFTAKDFRTWGGTLAAFQRFARTALPGDDDEDHEDDAPADERALTALQNTVIKEVAAALGNTPAICRKAYIHPAVFEGWRAGGLLRPGQAPRGERQWEAAALGFLKRARRSGARGGSVA